MKVAAIALLLTIASSANAQSRRPVELQPTGEFHGGEVTARNGERWLALTMNEDGSHVLVPAAVVVEAVEDPIVDEPGEQTGKRVTALGLETQLLVRGGKITAGPVTAAEFVYDGADRNDLDPELAWRLRFAGSEYSLSTERTMLKDGREQLQVVLRSERGSQVLATDHDSELAANLMWAGDLDRDGRLDLLIDLSNHYNLSVPTLFLSSAASTRRLVAAVAEYVITGC